ncbi:MAG: glutamyl-tRNA synthetase [Pirellulaceae bacterium]|jgi:glutamyl-tRNA synthetase
MVRTRFAPSPTGYLHIGGVRTALFNWLYARQNGGQFILRVDDTDQERNVAEALQPILDGFRWLGLDWDEGPEVGGDCGPYFQSQRGDRYQAAVDQLIDNGFAYYDYATPAELKQERETNEKEKRDFIYSRTWMAENDAQAKAFEAEGRPKTVRLKMPREGVCKFTDSVHGDQQFAWAKEQDSVIQRPNGTFIYHLATVVDDHDFRITDVIRASEHLSNTPRQIFIGQGLGYDIPKYAHLPVVNAPDGKKLSKRKLKDYLKHQEFAKLCDRGKRIATAMGMDVDSDDALNTFNPVIVDFYRDIGFLPDGVINYLMLLGWSLDDTTENFTREEMIQHFSFERVNKSPAAFDVNKLIAFQSRHMDALPLKQKTAMIVPFLQRMGLVETPPSCDTGPKVNAIVEAAAHRLEIAGDILDYADFFTADDALEFQEKAVGKHLKKLDDPKSLLQQIRSILADTDPFDVETLTPLLDQFIEAGGHHKRKTMQAIRVAITGKDKGFGTYETLILVGKDHCVARIDRCLEIL